MKIFIQGNAILSVDEQAFSDAWAWGALGFQGFWLREPDTLILREVSERQACLPPGPGQSCLLEFLGDERADCFRKARRVGQMGKVFRREKTSFYAA
jgi:hypothetical protein